MFDVHADEGFDRDMRRFTFEARDAAMASIKALAKAGPKHPGLVHLKGTRYPGSYRMRIRHYRVMLFMAPDAQLILLTAAFLKRRPQDYILAARRNETRLSRQGPPPADYVGRAKRRRK